MSLLLFIISSIGLLILGYIVFRLIVRREYKNRGKLSWKGWGSELIFFALHANFSYSFLGVSWPEWPELPANQIQKIIGLTLFSLGLILTILSMGFLGFKKAFGLDSKGLRTSGVYSYSRNPQMVFYTLLMLSIVILWFSWYGVVWFIIYLYIGYLMVITEEEYLSVIYGDAYEKYCSQVPRYMIFK